MPEWDGSPLSSCRCPTMGRCPGWWGEGGVETMRQEPEPSHTALSTKSLMLILLTQHRLTVFILYTFSALLPWLQVFWPISPSCSFPWLCLSSPILSHPSPSVVIRYSRSRSFPPAKKKAKASLYSSYLLIPFVSCYSLLRAGTLPDHRDPSSPGVPFAPGTLAGISEVPPPSPLSPPVWVCFREVRLKFIEL